MGTADIDNLNRRELFETLANKCKSRARKDIYCILIGLIIIIAFFIYFPQNQHVQNSTPHHRIDVMVYTALFGVICCTGIWLILHDYWYQKRIDTLDTPVQLLECLQKKIRIGNFSVLPIKLGSWLLTLYGSVSIFYSGSTKITKSETYDLIAAMTIGVVLFALYVIFFFKRDKMNRKDEEIIDQLQNLVEMY